MSLLPILHEIDLRLGLDEALALRRVGRTCRVTRRPDTQQGLPCIAGTRIPVRAIKDFYRAGYRPEAIVREYPSLTVEQVLHAVRWGRRDRCQPNHGRPSA